MDGMRIRMKKWRKSSASEHDRAEYGHLCPSKMKMVHKTTVPGAFRSGALTTNLLQNAVANGTPLSTALQEGYLITRILLLMRTTGKLAQTQGFPPEPILLLAGHYLEMPDACVSRLIPAFRVWLKHFDWHFQPGSSLSPVLNGRTYLSDYFVGLSNHHKR